MITSLKCPDLWLTEMIGAARACLANLFQESRSRYKGMSPKRAGRANKLGDATDPVKAAIQAEESRLVGNKTGRHYTPILKTASKQSGRRSFLGVKE